MACFRSDLSFSQTNFLLADSEAAGADAKPDGENAASE